MLKVRESGERRLATRANLQATDSKGEAISSLDRIGNVRLCRQDHREGHHAIEGEGPFIETCKSTILRVKCVRWRENGIGFLLRLSIIAVRISGRSWNLRLRMTAKTTSTTEFSFVIISFGAQEFTLGLLLFQSLFFLSRRRFCLWSFALVSCFSPGSFSTPVNQVPRIC